jgi:hypothetical protein
MNLLARVVSCCVSCLVSSINLSLAGNDQIGKILLYVQEDSFERQMASCRERMEEVNESDLCAEISLIQSSYSAARLSV